ncbi:MAG: PhnD/SsuA/transferrin family substrate-binding protein, partial [Gallionella sp.]
MLLCSLLLLCSPVWAKEEVKIGILAYRPQVMVQAKWQPLAAALNKALPDCHFVIDAYDYDDLLAAVASRQIDFVLTNPGSYLLMAHRSGLTAPLVTLSNLEQGKPVSAMGGVIFTRADRQDINKLQDLRGHTVALTTTASLGGYEMQAYELSQSGLRIPQDLHLMTTGMPHDKVVEAVLSKKSDVGFIRSGMLESMVDEDKLDFKQIKVINLQDLPGFPVAVSTRLYPEWPLAALPQTNRDLQRKLAAYLLTINENRVLTKALNINGFDVPSDYSSVETVLRELRMPPFDMRPVFTVEDIWLQYRWQLILSMSALTLITLLGFNLYLSNLRLQKRKQIVLEQTEQLRASNKLLDSIIENIPVMIYLKRASDLRYTLLNRRGESLLGYSREEVLEHDDHELFARTQAESALRDDRRALRSNDTIEIAEERIETPGGPRILHSKKLVLRDDLRNPLYLLCIAEDITERITSSQHLKELNSNLAATLQAIPDVLFELDQHGTYLNVWSQSPELLYTEKAKLLGHTVKEMLPTTAAQTVMTTLVEAQRDGVSRGRVIQLKFPSGVRWFELSVSIKLGTNDNEHRYIVVSREITQRKLIEQSLSQNEERLRLALNAAKQGWFDVNVQTGKVMVSPEYIQMLGHEPQTYHTDLDNWIANIHDEDREELLEVFRDCLASGEPRTMQYRRRNVHGIWMWISSVGQVTEWDAQHQPLRMVGIHTDISERKQAEAALQHANRSLAILSAVNRNLVHATDERRLLQSVCQTIVDQRGYRMAWVGYVEHNEACNIRPVAQVGEELGYLKNADIVWSDTPRGAGTTGRAIRTGKAQISGDMQNDASMVLWRDAARDRNYRSCISLPLAQQGKVFGVLVIYADQSHAFSTEDVELLTEMSNDLAFGVKSLQARHERDIALEALSVTALQLERANQQVEEERVMLAKRVEERTAQLSLANKAKDAFLATMSHEIRTPLGGLLGMMELLHLSQMNSKQQNMLEVARHSGKSLLRIVDDILDWSKIEAGKLAITPNPASLHETLHLINESYSEAAAAKGIKIQVHIDPRLSKVHRFDPIRVAQIMHNFTSNALKFTQLGSIEISATQLSREQD